MAGSDPDPHPHPHPQPQNQTPLFNKRQEVEVSSDEDGFRGAWYIASIVEYPPKSASKKRKKALVEYKTLLADDGSSPLTEQVDPGYIRPLPPDDSRGNRVFEENEAVDAKYRDGWWSGVVKKALEGSRYRVYFENPPDVIDFNGRDLRAHWDWVNGTWVRPEKQPITGSLFSSGTALEVNPDKENVRDTWFPAVVIKENEDNTFLVKHQSSESSDETGMVKIIVDSLHIRPTPPRYVDRNYELLEKVYAQYGLGWRAGVITKLLAGRRYNVFLKQGNEDKELDHLEMRPHVEWADGKWITKSKEVMLVSDNQEQIGGALNSSDNLEVALQVEKLDAAEDNTKGIRPCSESTRLLTDQLTPFNEESPPHTGAAMPLNKIKQKLTTPNSSDKRSRPSKKLKGNAAEDPLAQSEKQTDSAILKTFQESSTPKTEGKRTRCSTKPVTSDQPSPKTESLSTRKTVTKQQEVELAVQKVDIITRKGRYIKSPIKRLQSSAAVKKKTAVDATAKDADQIGIEKKQVGVPLILGLGAKGVETLCLSYSRQLLDGGMLKLMRDRKKNLNDSVGDKSMASKELVMLKSVGSSQRRKRGRPRKFALKAGDGDPIAGDTANEMVVKDHATNEVELPTQIWGESKASQNASREKIVEDSERDCITKEVDMAIAGMTNDVADDDQPLSTLWDQPLSTWFGGMHSSASVEDLSPSGLSSGRTAVGWNETQERQIIAMDSRAIDVKCNGKLDKNQCLPFLKKSPVWNTIESMEIFKIVPQKPHFRPLIECKEEYREGSAIGVMVTFASLFDKISSLQFDDSRSVFESTLESLLDLEKHGFDVSVPLDRVNELLSIKDGEDELLNESKDAERQIREHTDEKRKLDEKINDIQRKITELQEELAFSKSKMESKDLEIAELQLRFDAVNGRITNDRLDFEKIAAASWKLP